MSITKFLNSSIGVEWKKIVYNTAVKKALRVEKNETRNHGNSEVTVLSWSFEMRMKDFSSLTTGSFSFFFNKNHKPHLIL